MLTHRTHSLTANIRARHRVGVASTGLVAAGLLVLSAQTAVAHDLLLSSTPADGSTTAQLPSEITLVLSEAPLTTGAQLVLTNPNGKTLPAGDPAVETTHGNVTFPLETDGPAGTYTAAWHVVSSDGHPIEGEFDFTVEQGQAPADPPPSPTVSAPNPSATSGALEATAAPAPGATSATGARNGQAVQDPLLVVVVAVAVAVAALFVVTFITRRRDRSPNPEEQGANTDARQ